MLLAYSLVGSKESAGSHGKTGLRGVLPAPTRLEPCKQNRVSFNTNCWVVHQGAMCTSPGLLGYMKRHSNQMSCMDVFQKELSIEGTLLRLLGKFAVDQAQDNSREFWLILLIAVVAVWLCGKSVDMFLSCL